MNPQQKRRNIADKLVKQFEKDQVQYLLLFIDPEDMNGNYNIQHAGAKQIAWLFLNAAKNHELFAMLWVELNAMRIAEELEEDAKSN